MQNLSVAGLETEASVRNRNFIRDAYFGAGSDPNSGSGWQLNGGVVPVAPMAILNTDVTLYSSAFPYTMTLPLMVSGGRPPYTWSMLPHTPDAGRILVPGGSVSGNTMFGNFPTAALAQARIQVTDSVGALVSKVLNIAVVYSATTAPTTTASHGQ
jgi:hypothetical protein